MKNVRKDVRMKLLEGLVRKQTEAKKFGASIPKRYNYSTKRADHFIYVDYDTKELHFGTRGYDGTTYHTVTSF